MLNPFHSLLWERDTFAQTIVCAPFLLLGGVKPPTKFSKRGLDSVSIFRGALLGRRGVTSFKRGRGDYSFHVKNKLKSEIFNDKKGL